MSTPTFEDQMKMWVQCEEMKKRIQMQKVRDGVLSDQLKNTEEKKRELELKTAKMSLEKERLLSEMRAKDQEINMMEDHVEKMDGYLKTLFAGDPTDDELNGEKQELEVFKQEISRFAELVSKSPWIPEMEKLRKLVDEDEAKLIEEQRKIRLLEESVDEAKLNVALCQENSFVELVVKLVKYTAQRGEMLRIYAKGVAEHKWIVEELNKRNEESAADNVMEESASITDEVVGNAAIGEATADNVMEESASITDEVVGNAAIEEGGTSIIDESFESVVDNQVYPSSKEDEVKEDANASFMDFGSVVDLGFDVGNKADSSNKGIFDHLFAAIDAGATSGVVINPPDASPVPSHISFTQATTSTPQSLLGCSINATTTNAPDANTSFNDLGNIFGWGGPDGNASGGFFDFGFGDMDTSGADVRRDAK